MHTERFRQLRKESLQALFEKKNISNVWRKIVRDQLRSVDIKDLYDNYDFNYNIEDRAVALRSDILNGAYQVSVPLIYRMEKKYGVCRHLVIPQPTDALILQILVEGIAEKIIAKQPSENAFYSRDKHNVEKPHEAIEYGVSFREQWKKLQRKIYKFNEEKELLIVTDLANYYDSISLEELRRVFVSYTEVNEVVVDLLFKIIEGISWRPDYLPYSSKGLPTSNLEAIRLLAHSFLFEIDEVVKRKTNNSFARWMDDITIGVNNYADAVDLISSISDMLKSRGLALNLSKTAIYDSQTAKHHFQIDQNIYLDSVDKISRDSVELNRTKKELNKNFKTHFRDKSAKYWDKVSKRYITAFGKLKSKDLLKTLSEIYIKYPGLRTNLIYYLLGIGYSVKAGRKVLDILGEINIFDDLSLFQISHLITSWKIPLHKESQKQLLEFQKAITKLAFKQNESSGFYSLLWFNAKYATAYELFEFLRKYQNRWQSDSFLRRQATICLSRTMLIANGKSMSILENQISCGILSTVSVANQIKQFFEIENLDKKLNSYLFPVTKQVVYPLGKFLVLCSVLNSQKIRKNEATKSKIFEYVTDPVFLKILSTEYELSK